MRILSILSQSVSNNPVTFKSYCINQQSTKIQLPSDLAKLSADASFGHYDRKKNGGTTSLD